MARFYHKILEGTKHIGYLSATLEMPGVWSIYNKERKKIAMVAPDGSQFNLMFYGKHAVTTEYFMAKSFKGALARAFKMTTLPELDPPVEDPEDVPLAELDTPSDPAAAANEMVIDAFLEGLLAKETDEATKVYVLDLVVSKAIAMRTRIAAES